MTVLVEHCFPSERGNPRLKVLFGSDRNRISHASCVFEIRVEDDVSARYA